MKPTNSKELFTPDQRIKLARYAMENPGKKKAIVKALRKTAYVDIISSDDSENQAKRFLEEAKKIEKKEEEIFEKTDETQTKQAASHLEQSKIQPKLMKLVSQAYRDPELLQVFKEFLEDIQAKSAQSKGISDSLKAEMKGTLKSLQDQVANKIKNGESPEMAKEWMRAKKKKISKDLQMNSSKARYEIQHYIEAKKIEYARRHPLFLEACKVADKQIGGLDIALATLAGGQAVYAGFTLYTLMVTMGVTLGMLSWPFFFFLGFTLWWMGFSLQNIIRKILRK